MKLCTECVHFEARDGWPECSNPLMAYSDPVNGAQKRWFCWSARQPGGPCGPGAEKYEPIETRSAA